jgi:hypothetical protein
MQYFSLFFSPSVTITVWCDCKQYFVRGAAPKKVAGAINVENYINEGFVSV